MTLIHPSGSIVLPGVQTPFDYSVERIQTTGLSANGTVKVYDYQIQQYWITCKLRLDETQKNSLRNFISSIARFAYSSFTAIPDPGVDFGAGAGSQIAARYWGGAYAEKCVLPGRYEVTLHFRREAT